MKARSFAYCFLSQDMQQKAAYLDPREKQSWFCLRFQMASDDSTGQR
jgi:hypothetical protein